MEQLMKIYKRMKMNKRAQFLARDWVISLILFSGIIGLLVLMITSMATDYDNTSIVNSAIQENYANLEETTSIASQAFDAAQEKGGLSLIGTFDVLFSAAFTVFALIFNSVGLSTGYMTQFTEDFNVPTSIAGIFFGMIIAILMVILVFVIISTTTRRDF